MKAQKEPRKLKPQTNTRINQNASFICKLQKERLNISVNK